MTVQRFDRHADMSMETLREIGNIINKLTRDFDYLTNMLYGLYDGYLYYDLLIYAKEKVSPELYIRIENVIKQVKTYSTLTKSELP